MSKKYIGQINNDNFVYPNNKLAEYDVEIIHDLNENSVSGITSGFSIVYNSGTGNLQCSFTYTWYRNNAEVMIDIEGKLQILSLHIMGPNKMYFKPWICVGFIDNVNTAINTKTDTQNFVITPQMMGLASFIGGVYYGEIRFIGKRAIFPITASSNVVVPTPTPTPTITGTPTVTPTPGGPTATPTPTPTVTPTATPTDPCYCFPIVVTGNTLPPPEGGVIATLDYNDCYGTRTARAFLTGPGTYYQCIQTLSSVVQWHPEGTSGIDTSYLTLTYQTGNCRTGYVCSGYDPATTPTPTPTGAPPTNTPTPTPTGLPPTDTPTPTPTGVPPTDTPTPTPTGVPPTDTPTPTPTNTPTPTPTVTYTYLVNCSGTLQGYCLGELSPGQEVTINEICYVATTTTTSPTGTLISGTQTLGACCPTPTPTPTPSPVAVGIYTGATFGSSTAACLDSNAPNGTVYIANGDTLSDGDTLYTNPGLTVQFVGNDNYYRLYWNLTFYAADINGAGFVSNLTNCGTIPTYTPTPTATSTPTPTPTATPDPNFYFLVHEYACNGLGACEYVSEFYVANNVDLVIAPTQRYRLDPTSGLILRVMTAVGPQSPALITTMSGNGQVNCDALCPAVPTPTPTPTSTPEPPTATPTPTPTGVPPTDTPTPTPTGVPPTDTPTPTPTGVPPTNTPTPTPTSVGYDYYNADVYDCSDCGAITETILVAFDAGSVVTLNRFYQPQGGPDGFAYRITSSASAGVAYILTTIYGSNTTCALACSS